MDICILIPVFLISLFFTIYPYVVTASESDNFIVTVSYDHSVIYKTPLFDKEDTRYIILFKSEITDKYDDLYPTTDERKFDYKTLLLDDLVIKISQGKVSIVEETSPNHICSRQGEISNPNNPPLICLPNYVSIKIVKNNAPVNPDDIIVIG